MDLSFLVESEFLVKTVVVGFVLIVGGLTLRMALGQPGRPRDNRKG